MPRQYRANLGQEGPLQENDATARDHRLVFGDVSNRRRTRSLAAKERGEQLIHHPLRRSTRGNSSSCAHETLLVEPDPASKDDKEFVCGAVAGRSKSDSTGSSALSQVSAGPHSSESDLMCKAKQAKIPHVAKAAPKRGRDDQTDDELTIPPNKATRLFEPRREKRKPRSRSRAGQSAKPRQLSIEILQEVDHKLVQHPFNPEEFTVGLSLYDAANRGNVLEVPEYVSDVFQRLYESETKCRPRPYLHKRPQLNPTMRAIVVDWLVEVHMKFRLAPETLYLCVNIIDRYLMRADIDRTRLQLLGVTALLIACKYEEIYPPEVKDCVYICDRAYSPQQVLDMEEEILRQLDFRVSVSTAWPFLERFLFITKATRTVRFASSYYLDRILQEYESLQFRPSVLAAASVCLALNHPEVREYDDLGTERPGVPDVLLNYSTFDEETILSAAKMMAYKVSEEVVTTSNRVLLAVKRKYEFSRFACVSCDFPPPSADDITSP